MILRDRWVAYASHVHKLRHMDAMRRRRGKLTHLPALADHSRKGSLAFPISFW